MENIPNSGLAAREIIHEGQAILDRVTQNKRNSFLQKFFPDPRERALVEAEVGIVRSELEFKRRMLEKVREAQSQSMTERLNEYLIREKTTIRSETAAFMLSRLKDLQDRMQRIFKEFYDSMEVNTKQVEAMTLPKLREVGMQQLDKDVDDFMQLRQELMDQFQSIISERVK
jgi:Ni,Fe-hydrogenase I large subunit